MGEECVSWVQVSVLRSESERIYCEDLHLQKQACAHVFPANSSQLFFKSCHRLDLNHLPHHQPTTPFYFYRLGPSSNLSHCLDPAITQAPEGHGDLSLWNKTATTSFHNHNTEPPHSGRGSTLRMQTEITRFHYSCHGHVLVPADSPVPAVPFGQPCLKRFVEGHCYDGVPVPRVVHYVWFSGHTMDWVTFLSVLAAYRFLKPCLILFHADSVPQGLYWRALPSLVPVLVLVQRSAPVQVFGRPLGAVQHKSDIARLEALKEYGGIYLDGDQVVLKSLDEFRHKEFVMGHENANNLANSLLISAPRAKFIEAWYRNYRSYNPKQWGIHSTFLPLILARVYPKMIHNAGYAFIKPDLPGIREIWEGHYNWTTNHAVHLYYRSMVEGKQIRTDYRLSELLALNSSLGEIARHVFFGSKNVCFGGS
ncbi:hypothetical protein ACOMHN_016800 [Nucella lapillus]